MSNSSPVIFLAFANEQGDGSRYLRNLPGELRALETVLEPLKQHGVELVIKSNTTLEDIVETFRKYRNRIVIFHYAGHASSYELLLEAANGQSQKVNAKGLTQFLSVQEGLKFIFLNGCSTQTQAQGLVVPGPLGRRQRPRR